MNDADTNTMLLRGGKVILPEGLAQRKSLVIQGDQIARIVDEEVDVVVQRALDLEGLMVLPGFVDVHIHGAAGLDAMTASADDLHSVARFLARQGVTAWLPTLVPAPGDDYQRAVAAIEELMGQQDARAAAARVVGVHYEGPFVSQHQCGALNAQFFSNFATLADLERLPTIKMKNATHMMTLAPEVEGGVALISELKRRGWVVSIGHTRAAVDVLDKAYAAGARHMTHFMNAMPPLHQRAPGPVGWGLSNNQVSCDVIADGIHLDPFVLSLLVKLKTPDRLVLISDAIAAAGKGDGEYKIWGEAITVKDGRTSNTRGSIAGSVITMLDAEKMMLSLGVNQVDIARMTAANPARLLGLYDDCGSIEEGKRADLVGLDDAGNVRLTIVGGRVTFQ
jgi:N-acetylglucosamine-6-phosphate deacetylase